MPVRDGIRGRPQEFPRGRGRESGAVVVEFEEGAAFFYVVGCGWGGDAGRGWVSGRRLLYRFGQDSGLTRVHWEDLGWREAQSWEGASG